MRLCEGIKPNDKINEVSHEAKVKRESGFKTEENSEINKESGLFMCRLL